MKDRKHLCERFCKYLYTSDILFNVCTKFWTFYVKLQFKHCHVIIMVGIQSKYPSHLGHGFQTVDECCVLFFAASLEMWCLQFLSFTGKTRNTYMYVLLCSRQRRQWWTTTNANKSNKYFWMNWMFASFVCRSF